MLYYSHIGARYSLHLMHTAFRLIMFYAQDKSCAGMSSQRFNDDVIDPPITMGSNEFTNGSVHWCMSCESIYFEWRNCQSTNCCCLVLKY